MPLRFRPEVREQVEDDNAVLLTWKPPLANDEVDESVVEYEVVADGSGYSTVEARPAPAGG